MARAERVLDVLMAVATSPEPLPAKRVGELAGLPLSSAYRHLAVLKERGFVSDLGRDVGFSPGPVCLRMAWTFDRASHVLSVARPEMQALSLRTQESVGLMKAVGTDVLCLEMVESPLSLRCSFGTGRSQPLIRGASAKALLAFLPDAVREEVLGRLLGGDAERRSALMRELAAIRARGYATSEGEIDAGVWGASAPVFSSAGRLEAGLSLMAPSVRVGDRAAALAEQTVEAARAISARLAQM